MPTMTFFNLKQEKRNRITNAALKEFSIHDFDHVNIQNIIKDANISRGSFYQYFNHLEDLFDHLTNMVSVQKATYFKTHGEFNEQSPFFDRLGELYRLGYQFASDNPLVYEASKHMIKPALLKTSRLSRLQYFKDELLKDKTNGYIGQDVDVDMLSDIILSFFDELLQSHYIDEKLTQSEVDQRFERFKKLLKKGISPYV